MAKYVNNWKRLLSFKRVKIDSKIPTKISLEGPRHSDRRSPYEVDYERIIFSYSLRRLAGKTQVHPFSDIDYIHNRLTHSIEVSSVAYSLVFEVGKFLLQKRDIRKKDISDICWITQAAGLAHDIGNPPYGHAGEDSIRLWAKKNEMSMASKPFFPDFLNFDGNAQTFRLASREDLRESTYLRFTAGTLGAIVKYPYTSDEGLKKPKFAAFSTEKEILDAVWMELGLLRDGRRIRHPLSYLSEAADDICYRISDFEDAVLMGVLTHKEVADIFLKLLPPDLRQENRGKPIQRLRALAIHNLIQQFVDVFQENYDEIMDGAFIGDLRGKMTSTTKIALNVLEKKYGILFCARKKVVVEISAYKQIAAILDLYRRIIDEALSMPISKRHFNRLSHCCQQLVLLAWGEKFYNKNAHKSEAWWMHTVLDYVVGMTDEYLNSLSQELCL